MNIEEITRELENEKTRALLELETTEELKKIAPEMDIEKFILNIVEKEKTEILKILNDCEAMREKVLKNIDDEYKTKKTCVEQEYLPRIKHAMCKVGELDELIKNRDVAKGFFEKRKTYVSGQIQDMIQLLNKEKDDWGGPDFLVNQPGPHFRYLTEQEIGYWMALCFPEREFKITANGNLRLKKTPKERLAWVKNKKQTVRMAKKQK